MGHLKNLKSTHMGIAVTNSLQMIVYGAHNEFRTASGDESELVDKHEFVGDKQRVNKL